MRKTCKLRHSISIQEKSAFSIDMVSDDSTSRRVQADRILLLILLRMIIQDK
jgi:hypothetical protein